MTGQGEQIKSPLANYERDGDVLRVLLPCGRVMLADAEDEEIIQAHRWYAKPGNLTNYVESIVRSNGLRRRVGLAHRIIAGAPDGVDVDHINRNGLDNRKSNLRLCTPSENRMNSIGKARARRSSFKGITEYGAARRYWKAEIKVGSDRYRVYGCRTEQEAAAFYDLMARKFHGSFALLNFPNGVPKAISLGKHPEQRISQLVKGAKSGRRRSAMPPSA